MKQEEFSGKLMDKLAGELSENEAILFQENLTDEPELVDEYDFFTEAWNSLDGITINSKPSENLAIQFYDKLDRLEEKQKQSLQYKVATLYNQYNVGSIAKMASIAAVLVVVGFFLGGVYSEQDLASNTKNDFNQNPSSSELEYFKTTEKLDFVQSITHQSVEDKETFTKLKDLVAHETNTNVRLAALNKLNQYYSNDPKLNRFLANQFEIEQSEIIQVELLNLMIDNYHTGETIRKMENILVSNQNLNPFVQEKIKKDLPVLRASFVQ